MNRGARMVVAFWVGIVLLGTGIALYPAAVLLLLCAAAILGFLVFISTIIYEASDDE